MTGACVAWTTAGNNQTANIFAAKLGWDGEQTRKNNMLINLFSQTGKTIGAFVGGQLIPSGRKKVFICFNILSVLSCLMMQYLSIYALCLGKLLNGITVTIVMVSCGKMINETVPVYLLDTYGIITQQFFAMGLLLSLGFGLGLPSRDFNPEIVDSESNNAAKLEDINDHFWRVIYAFPALLNTIMLCNFLLFIKEEPIMFSLSEGNEESALKLIDKIYHPNEDRHEILTYLKK